jgi:hypothetical protein
MTANLNVVLRQKVLCPTRWEPMGSTEDLNAGHHVVQFSGHDEELAFNRVVGQLVRQAVAGGVLGAVRTFALTRDAPAAARHFAVATTGHWGAGDLAGDVALVVTELAANAIRHARSGFTVILSSRRNVLRIAVRDASPVPAVGPGLTPAPLHGLGAVDAMASRWGVEPLGSSGKTVWVELSR